jgi:4-hydroxy-tetrahydrodipicolinate synthase
VADPVFTGVGVALLTLFDERGDLDGPATGDLAARLAALGVRGVVVAGSTGEAATLSPDERDALLAAVRAAVPPGVAVVAGTGAPSARQAAELTRRAAAGGADAVLALSPPLADDPRPYYDEVAAAAGDVPVLAYHFPRASAPGIAVEALAGLPVRGLKDSTGDPARLLETLDRFPHPVWVGSSAVLALAGPVGCAGAILAAANLDPETAVAAFAGDAAAQRAMLPAHRAASSIRRLKAAVAERFATSPVARVAS